jgi:hypothetical protein
MTAPLHIIIGGPFDMLEAAGRHAMSLGTRPRWKFAVVDGGRRRFHDRTPRPAVNLKIVSEKEQPCR